MQHKIISEKTITDKNQCLMFNLDFKYYIISENLKESCDCHILRNRITNI